MDKLYKIAHCHKLVFGDDIPRTSEQIYIKVFGDTRTDAIEGWSQDPKLIINLKVLLLTNYCIEPGWEKKYPKHKHELLIQDIKKNGIKIPLVVILNVNGKYNVVEGNHRAGAANLLGLNTVPVFLLEEQ